VPLGDPIANTRLYVLDDALCLVPAGLTGELWLAGEGLARGYRARAALTAERFVPDPFGASPGARMYRTGDIVKVHHDGAIEWIGRRDHQVKLRGHRIEPGEIEAALLRAPGVREAAVVAARTPAGAELRAFVVTDGGALDDRQVRADLESALPAYMVPQRFVGLAALPRSTSGKIDRAALASYVPASPPPRPARAGTAFEQRILAVWRTALGRDDVGLDDNFFDAGGNSLLIAQVHSELQARLGREWPLVRMLEHPTVGALATFLNADTPGDLSPEARRRSASRRSALLQRQSAAVGAR
jgi:acyl carrier protein